MNFSLPDFDVGIIGGGPAGSSMAAYLAKAGVNCVVFERDLMPRAHVGESLVPSSTRVFRDLDFLPKMEESGFPKKFGAAWTAAHGGSAYDHNFDGLMRNDEADIRFEERDQGVGQITPGTWTGANSISCCCSMPMSAEPRSIPV